MVGVAVSYHVHIPGVAHIVRCNTIADVNDALRDMCIRKLKISDMDMLMTQGFVELNVPDTPHHKCVVEIEKVEKILEV